MLRYRIKFYFGIVTVLIVALLFSIVTFAATTDNNSTDTSRSTTKLAPGNLGRSYTAGKATVKVDGVIDDVWYNVEPFKPDVPYDQAYPDPDFDFRQCDVQVKVLYDDYFFYFLVIAHSADEYGGDEIVVFINEGERTARTYGEYAYHVRFVFDPEFPQDGIFPMVGSNGTGLHINDIVTDRKIVLSDDKKTATVEFALRRLNPAVKDGDAVGLEVLFEDWGYHGDFFVMLNGFHWNICQVDENGNPTGIRDPKEETKNFGDLVLGPMVGYVAPSPTPEPTPVPKPTDPLIHFPIVTPSDEPVDTPVATPSDEPKDDKLDEPLLPIIVAAGVIAAVEVVVVAVVIVVVVVAVKKKK